MAVLEKIRVKLGILITVLIAVALLSFIIDPNTLSSTFQMLSSDNQVGEMDGKGVSYQDFYKELDYYTRLAELTGQGANDEQAQEALRNAAWQSIFDKEVFVPRALAAGIDVCDNEILDLSNGSEISPVYTQQALFRDENGLFSREALAQFVSSIDTDPSGSAGFFYNYLENAVYKQQLYTKYASLIEKSYTTNAVEAKRINMDNNVISDVDFVLSPLSFQQDSTIKVTPAEIKAFYDARKENMKQPANRDIEYVMYEVVPSQSDIDATKEEFDSLYEGFVTADNLKNYIALYSESKWDLNYYSKEQLASIPEFADYAFAKKVEGVSPIYTTDERLAAIKVVEKKTIADSAEVFYQVFPLTAEASADSLVALAKKSGNVPGFIEAGWLSQEMTAANGLSDLNVALDPAQGKVIKVRSTALQAFFVLYVNNRTKGVEKVQIATLSKGILPSEDTYRDYLMRATDLADKAAGDYTKFAKVVKEENLPVTPASNITEATRRIGVAENAREVVRWAFEKGTKRGDVSDVLVVDNKYYFVAAVTQTRKEGYIALNDIADQISMTLTSEKMVEKLRDEMAAQVEGCVSLEEAAEKLGTTVSHRAGIAFGSIQNQSLDPKFIGAVASAEPGKIYGPVAGEIGAYLFQIADRQSGSFYTDTDAQQANLAKASYQVNIMQNVLAQIADIRDNRARFF